MFVLISLILVLIISFFMLVKSADFLISSSSEIGRRAGISKFVIGLTLIAIGTSLPEFFTALIAIFSSSNSSAFVIGTIIGSNISNILLVFAVLITFSKKFKVDVKSFDIFFLIFSTIALIFTVLYGKLNIYQGLFYTILFVIYIYINVKKGSKKDFEDEVKETEDSSFKRKNFSYILSIFVLSLIGLNIAAKGVVYGIENLVEILLIPIEFLTLTTVAFATSLPEIVVTYSSAKNREFDLAVGNIIGSNISNILFILGSVWIITDMSFSPVNYYTSLIILAIVTLLFMALLFKKNINKKYGYAFFTLYILYIFLIFWLTKCDQNDF